jgi:hypothetical protein
MPNFKKTIVLALLILELLFFQKALAQGGYLLAKGKILDKNTNLPLIDAYISIPSIGYGTSPNIDGDFLFQYPKISIDSMVNISHIGYKSLEIRANELQKENNVFNLEAIPLFDANYGLSDVRIMLMAAVDSVKKTFNNQPYFQLGFYHEQVNLKNLGAIKINEGVVRIERFPDTKEKIEKVKLLRGRRIEWKGQSSKINGWGFQNGTSLVCRSLETTIPDFLQKKQMKKYDYRLDSLMSSYNDLPLFIIHFWPLNDRSKGSKRGTIYLEPETKTIVRIEYFLTEKGVNNLIDRKAGPVKIDGKSTKMVFQYSKFNNKWSLQSSRADFVINFEDNLDKKYSVDTEIMMRYIAFENLKLLKSGIYENEILNSTDNFIATNSVNTEYWSPYSYLLNTLEASKLSKVLR